MKDKDYRQSQLAWKDRLEDFADAPQERLREGSASESRRSLAPLQRSLFRRPSLRQDNERNQNPRRIRSATAGQTSNGDAGNTG